MASKSNRQTGFDNEKESTTKAAKILSKTLSTVLWLSFILNVLLLSIYYPDIPRWTLGNLIKIDGFTLLIWATVTFFSALISSYATTYLQGFKYQSKFMWLCLAFTGSVMLLVMSNHVLLLIVSWFLMLLYVSINWCR
jgi:NAD(P)H-quinone oxidoreductase subunit 5